MSTDEARAFEQIAALAGVTMQPMLPEVQVTRLELVEPVALLVQNPEPIDWRRTALELSRATRPGAPVVTPQWAKLTDVTFGMSDPNEESVTILLLEPARPGGLRIDYKTFPGALASLGPGKLLFADDFDATAGLLFREDFGPSALDHYDHRRGDVIGPVRMVGLRWRHRANRQYLRRQHCGAAPEKPGTLALANASDAWTDVRMRVTLTSVDDGAIGVVSGTATRTTTIASHWIGAQLPASC
jgi:hypothetical protein